jgi:ABC-type uncharacterized transport system permease subunit
MEIKKMPNDSLSFLQRLSEYGVWTYFVFLIISCWAGTVKFLLDIKKGEKPSVINWFIETSVSGFVGFIFAMACQYYQVDVLLTGVIVGIAAHNGTRSLYFLSNFIKKNTIDIDLGQEKQPAKVYSKKAEKNENK